MSQAGDVEELLASARAGIRRYTAEETLEAGRGGAVLVDIRPLEQRRRDGLVPGAVVVDRNVFEWRMDPRSEWRNPELARTDVSVIVICNEGYQSSLAAATLRGFGLDAGDLIDGVQGWIARGLPLEPGVGPSAEA